MKRGIVVALAVAVASLVAVSIWWGHHQKPREGQLTIDGQRAAALAAGTEILREDVKIIDSRRHDDAENLFVVESITTTGTIRGILINRDTGAAREYK